MNPTGPPSVEPSGTHLTQVPQFSVIPYPREGVTNFHGRGMKGQPTLNGSTGEDNTRRQHAGSPEPADLTELILM